MNTDTQVLFAYFIEYVPLLLDDNLYEECEKFSNSKNSVSACCLVFA